ncbi:MAG: DUF4139 domain-containing protein [Archangiaceae bacterium]|nr:DUF4139 domain-containing protein [Archangiaceae bacterium]
MNPSLTSLPVRRVVLLEDRAQVERGGEVTLPSGVCRLRIEGISVAAVDRSLKVEAPGARVLEARLRRAWKEQPRGGLPADASELRKQVHALEREAQELFDQGQRLTATRELVQKARADLLREINEAVGFGRVDAGSWATALETLAGTERTIDDAERDVAQRSRLNQLKLAESQTALAVSEQPDPAFECAVEVTLDGQGGASALRVSYLVPCALWRPAYRATLKGAQVHLECEAVVWQHTGEEWRDVELRFSTARPTLGTRPPTLTEDVLRLRPKQELEKKVVSVAVREEVIATTGEGGTRPADELPGLDDGGEAVLLSAPAKGSVPSDGLPHRVPLSAFDAPATVERVCPAELSPAVSLLARFANAGPHVLLAGPVDLLRQSGFVGRGQLKFAGVGETVLLSFGSEDGMRVVRQLEQKTEEARLTGRRTTRHQVKLFVSNASDTGARVVLEERVPVSEVKEVEVQVVQRDCQPAPSSVSKDGVARIEVECAAGATHEVLFVWELSAAAKVAGL